MTLGDRVITRYHKDVGLPDVPGPRPGLPLTYTDHARRELFTVERPRFLPHPHMVIEVQMVGTQVLRYVVRCPLPLSYDLILVIRPDGLVLTGWTNQHGDNHETLHKERYATL